MKSILFYLSSFGKFFLRLIKLGLRNVVSASVSFYQVIRTKWKSFHNRKKNISVLNDNSNLNLSSDSSINKNPNPFESNKSLPYDNRISSSVSADDQELILFEKKDIEELAENEKHLGFFSRVKLLATNQVVRGKKVNTLLHDKSELKRKIREVQNKGHQRLSIMIIPHGNKKIINFHISLYLILFSILLMFIVIIVSLSELSSEKKVIKERSRLGKIDSNNYNEILSFRESRLKIEDIEEKISDNHQIMLTLIEANDDEYRTSEKLEMLSSLVNAEIIKEEKKDNLHYLSEVVKFRKLQKRLLLELSALKTISAFIEQRSMILRNTPLGFPIRGRITSGFGWRASPYNRNIMEQHFGLDIAAPIGTPIVVTADGFVSISHVNRTKSGYGMLVEVKHRFGFSTRYAHCSKLFVSVGDYVKKGQVIALVGNTGRSTGPHTHYEIRYGINKKLNPMNFNPRL